jgi:hypothetical protein
MGKRGKYFSGAGTGTALPVFKFMPVIHWQWQLEAQPARVYQYTSQGRLKNAPFFWRPQP